MRRALIGLFAMTLAAIPWSSVSAEVDTLMDGPAPSFDLPTLDGGRLDLASLRGKIVVLHFGTGW